MEEHLQRFASIFCVKKTLQKISPEKCHFVERNTRKNHALLVLCVV